jgi:hypothetical protein
MSGESLLIYICNFHFLSNLLLIYIYKLHCNPPAMSNDINGNRRKQKYFGRNNACELVLQSIKKFPTSIALCEAALDVVSLLCRYDEDKKTENLENISLFGDLGVCDVLTKVNIPLIYICIFHVLIHLLLIYICKTPLELRPRCVRLADEAS